MKGGCQHKDLTTDRTTSYKRYRGSRSRSRHGLYIFLAVSLLGVVFHDKSAEDAVLLSQPLGRIVGIPDKWLKNPAAELSNSR